MDTSLEIFFVAAAVLYALYYYLTMHFDFWKVRGIPGPKPIPLFGNAYRYMVGKMSWAEFIMDVYEKYKGEPVVGLFLRRTPALVIKDPELIQDVLIRDFSKIMDRPLPKPEVDINSASMFHKMSLVQLHEWINEKNPLKDVSIEVLKKTPKCSFIWSRVGKNADPMSQNLVNLEAKRWKPLRAQMTPVFTAGKLKGMFSMILECAEQLENSLDTLISKEEPTDVRELAGQFTTDVIASCAFGIETNSLLDKENEFRRIGRGISMPGPWKILRFRMSEYCEGFFDLLGYVLPSHEVSKFFVRAVTNMMEFRKKNNIVRSDLINVLLDLEKHPEKLGETKVTKEYLTAQAFAFFVAGFETSETAISNTLYELALNPVMQEKLRQEILEHDAKHNGEWKYETVQAMEYLDKIFKETLRKYPPIPAVPRRATEDYTFKNPNIWIPKGTKLWIPIYAIHHDPDIYPNPKIYDPDRFNADLVKTRHPMYHIPFGDGPRNCIGARFAAYQIKIGLIKIIRKYKVEPCEKTPSDPYELHPLSSLILKSKEDLYLNITKLKN